MDKNTKVVFTLSIGFAGAEHREELTLESLGYEPDVDKDLDKFLEETWNEWSNNYIDGGWWIK